MPRSQGVPWHPVDQPMRNILPDACRCMAKMHVHSVGLNESSSKPELLIMDSNIEDGLDVNAREALKYGTSVD